MSKLFDTYKQRLKSPLPIAISLYFTTTFVMCQLKCHAAFAKGGPVPYATQISRPLYGSFTLLFHEN